MNRWAVQSLLRHSPIIDQEEKSHGWINNVQYLPIKVGVITDLTGPLSFMGIANANVARMVIDDINAKGGLLGRQLDLYLEDSATTDSVAEARLPSSSSKIKSM